MTGQELVNDMRESKLDDVSPPYLWSDPELLRFLNYAEVQACRRAHLLIDATTANDSGTAATAGTAGQKPLCTLTIAAGQATYNLSPKILQVRRCQLRSMSYPLLGPVTYEELDERLSGWWGTAGTVITSGTGGATTNAWTAGEAYTAGTSVAHGTHATAGTYATAGTIITATLGGLPMYFLNEPTNTITFVQAPSADDTAQLIVSRIPLVSFTLSTSPEIEEKYHEGLMDWAAHLAFRKPDSDTLNLNLAKMYEDMFVRSFGTLPDAYSEKMRKTLSMQGRMRPREWGT
jgi:hypothetical protein